MSFHQISDGSRHYPKSRDEMDQRMLAILLDRDQLDSERKLVSSARLVLTHGTLGRPTTRPTWLRRGPLGNCYQNALRALLSAPGRGLRYVEGYGYTPDTDIVYEHGWLQDEDGNVLDPTWPQTWSRSYIGVEFDNRAVRRAASDGEPVIFGDWSRDFSLHLRHSECCGPVPEGMRAQLVRRAKR